MDIKEILNHLPHRYPFLLVDRVVSCEPGKSILAIKNVTINEPFFPGHFPGHPVMPGVMIVEALAQAAAILCSRTLNLDPRAGYLYYFVGIDECRFKKPVVPGDQLTLDVALLRMARNVAKFNARALVDGQLVSEAQLMCAIKAPEAPAP